MGYPLKKILALLPPGSRPHFHRRGGAPENQDMCRQSYLSCVIEKIVFDFGTLGLIPYMVMWNVTRLSSMSFRRPSVYANLEWNACSCPSSFRNCITVAITAAKFGNNAKVFEMTSKWRHVVNNNSKCLMKFSPKFKMFNEVFSKTRQFSEKRRTDS